MNTELLGHLPKAIRIKEALKAEISAGMHGSAHSRFMTVRSIAASRRVTIKTAHRIMTLLKQEGLVRMQGKKHEIADSAKIYPRKTRETLALLGLVVTNLENPFFAILAREVEFAAKQAGFSVMLAASNYEPARERDAVRSLCEAGARGILLCPAETRAGQNIFASIPIPSVLLGRRPKHSMDDAVLVHNRAAGRMVAKHFLNMHLVNFAYFGLSGFHPNPRFEGFQAGLREAGCRVPEANLVMADPRRIDAAADKIQALLGRIKNPLAVFCFHDMLALEFSRVCKKIGLAMPRDVAICGFDNLPIASAMNPQLTSVAYPIKEMAEAGIRRLLEKMRDRSDGGRFLCYIRPNLVIRESTSHVPPTPLEISAADYTFNMVV